MFAESKGTNHNGKLDILHTTLPIENFDFQGTGVFKKYATLRSLTRRLVYK